MELLEKIFSYPEYWSSGSNCFNYEAEWTDIAEVPMYTLCIAISDISIPWSLQQRVYIVVDLSASVHYKFRNEFLHDISIGFLYVSHSHMSHSCVNSFTTEAGKWKEWFRNDYWIWFIDPYNTTILPLTSASEITRIIAMTPVCPSTRRYITP